MENAVRPMTGRKKTRQALKTLYGELSLKPGFEASASA
jgi:hypothetical protein